MPSFVDCICGYDASVMHKYLLIGGIALFGCGESSSSPDAQPEKDAQEIDATVQEIDSGMDAFTPCPGETTLEFGVVDWESNENLFDVAVQVAGGNSASSAPNGRVVICVGQTGPVVFTLMHPDYLPRIHTTSAEHIAVQTGNGIAPSFRLLKDTTLQSVYSDAQITLAAAGTTVIVMTDSQAGAERADVTVDIGNAFDGAFTPATNVLSLDMGNVSKADGRVLFLNTAVTPTTSTLSIDNPTGCTFPASFELASTGISSVSVSCPL